MATEPAIRVVSYREPPRHFLRAWFDAFAQRYPFLGLLCAVFASNLVGSFFSFFYNRQLIVERILNSAQKDVFWNLAAPLYNVLAYPLALTVFFSLTWSSSRCLGKLRRGERVEPDLLLHSQRRMLNFPMWQLIVNPIGVLPGAVFFPWMIVHFGGVDSAAAIWAEFGVSFVVSAVFTTVQTLVITQAYLTAYVYPDLFKETRPEDVSGVLSIPFTWRLVMMWLAVAVMPLVALLAVMLSFINNPDQPADITWFAIGLAAVSALSGGAIFRFVGLDLWRWMSLHTAATGEIAQGNFDIRIDHPRADEWGRLTNRFNDMAVSLNRAWESHETLGQLVSPEVRDEILRRMHGFEVEVQEITVLFVDIRGFTARSSGVPPEKIGALLNRFLTLAVQSIEEKGGYVNKFLGDGVMALFGATHVQDDHADLALASARELLRRLASLNEELAQQGEAPLAVGIGIHTGPALVGCFGATVHGDNGQPLMRREFSAIGETVNLCQRLEQLTKKAGGPILLSEGTRLRLRKTWPLDCVGPQDLPGSPEPMVVYKAGAG